MSKSFTNPEKYLKKIKKTERLAEYYEIVDTLIREQELQQEWSKIKIQINLITFILADSEIMLGDAVGGMIINIH